MSIASLNEGRARSRRALALALGVTGTILVAEVVGGILTNSLALLADAGHMASDLGALALSLVAVWLASRPPSLHRTYGFQRAEVLATLVNSLTLIAIAGYVFWEASRRFGDPPDVASGPMLAIAALGLSANAVSAYVLSHHARSGLNLRAAFLHVAGDAAASVGVIVAALVMITTGQFIADPLISVLIGALILVGAFRLTWEATQILLDTTPSGLSSANIQAAMLETQGVHGIHDLHVRTITSGFISLSAHVETDEAHDQHDILVALRTDLAQRFGIEHATIQLETSALHEELEACCGVDSEEGVGEHAAFHG